MARFFLAPALDARVTDRLIAGCAGLSLALAWSTLNLFRAGVRHQHLLVLILVPSAAAGAAVGYAAGRALRLSPRRAWLRLCASTLAAGAAVGALAAIAGAKLGQCLHGTLLGLACGVLALPFVLGMARASRRLAAIRAPSLIASIDHRALLTIAATGVALVACASSPEWISDPVPLSRLSAEGPGALAAVATMTIAAVLVADILALATARRLVARVATMYSIAPDELAREVAAVDVGVGDVGFGTSTLAPTPYRIPHDAVAAVRGQFTLATRAAIKAVVRDAGALVLSTVCVLIVLGADRGKWTLGPHTFSCVFDSVPTHWSLEPVRPHRLEVQHPVAPPSASSQSWSGR